MSAIKKEAKQASKALQVNHPFRSALKSRNYWRAAKIVWNRIWKIIKLYEKVSHVLKFIKHLLHFLGHVFQWIDFGTIRDFLSSMASNFSFG